MTTTPYPQTDPAAGVSITLPPEQIETLIGLVALAIEVALPAGAPCEGAADALLTLLDAAEAAGVEFAPAVPGAVKQTVRRVVAAGGGYRA